MIECTSVNCEEMVEPPSIMCPECRAVAASYVQTGITVEWEGDE